MTAHEEDEEGVAEEVADAGQETCRQGERRVGRQLLEEPSRVTSHPRASRSGKQRVDLLLEPLLVLGDSRRELLDRGPHCNKVLIQFPPHVLLAAENRISDFLLVHIAPGSAIDDDG